MSKGDRMARLDRIKWAIDNESDVYLSDAERTEKVELLSVVSLLLNPLKSTQSIVKLLKEEHGLSERAAFQRLTDAKFVFGNVFAHDRALERLKAYQRAEMAWKMARQQKYVDGMVRANEQMLKIVGADDPNDSIDPTKMEPSVYKVALPRSEIKAIQQLVGMGAIDLGAMMAKAGLLTDAVEVPMQQEVEEEEDEQQA
jgi:hypothetical protein